MGFPMKMLSTESDIGGSSRKSQYEEDHYAVGTQKYSLVFEDDFNQKFEIQIKEGTLFLSEIDKGTRGA